MEWQERLLDGIDQGQKDKLKSCAKVYGCPYVIMRLQLSTQEEKAAPRRGSPLPPWDL